MSSLFGRTMQSLFTALKLNNMQKFDKIYVETTWEKKDNTGFFEATIYVEEYGNMKPSKTVVTLT